MAPTGFWDNGMHEPTTRKVTVAPTLVDVASRGRLRLRSADPRWHPSIDPAYYDDPRDLDAMVRGVQRLFETVLTGRMRQHIAYPFLPPSDSPTEADIAEHLRRTTQTLYHPVGTCAMGLGEQAVVDPQLGCTASRGCAWPTRPSCPSYPGATPTPPRS